MTLNPASTNFGDIALNNFVYNNNNIVISTVMLPSSYSSSLNSSFNEYHKIYTINDTYSSTPDNNNGINDIEMSMSTNAQTLEVLNMCNKKIIFPFNVILIMIGWRPMTHTLQCSDRVARWVTIINHVLHSILILLLCFSYIYQVITCRFMMSKSDVINRITTPASPTGLPISTHSSHEHWKEINTAEPIKEPQCAPWITCYHIPTTYIIPNIFHLTSYIIGFFYYRIKGNEDIDGLIEKTVQYSTTGATNKYNLNRIRCILRIWLILAVIWVAMSTLNHILFAIAFQAFASPLYIFKINSTADVINDPTKHFLFACDFIGYIIMSVVTVAIVLHYTIYCELVKLYLEAICKKIEIRSIKLGVVKNDIHNISIATSLINGTVGTMTNLIFLVYLNLLIVGINMFFNANEGRFNIVMAYRLFYVLHLIPLLIVPLIQCARVNRSVKLIKKWALHMSVFGYRKERRKEIDSFLLYASNFQHQVKIAFVPLQWHHIQWTCMAVGLILISLTQSSVFDNVVFLRHL